MYCTVSCVLQIRASVAARHRSHPPPPPPAPADQHRYYIHLDTRKGERISYFSLTSCELEFGKTKTQTGQSRDKPVGTFLRRKAGATTPSQAQVRPSPYSEFSRSVPPFAARSISFAIHCKAVTCLARPLIPGSFTELGSHSACWAPRTEYLDSK
ncbi:hypothetical protein BJV78DRAFT_751427 [Lactifluus subvellereus]|nr:hypothetical protein BJV78DRAFT_751427 [Lactifluus subvellereus]